MRVIVSVGRVRGNSGAASCIKGTVSALEGMVCPVCHADLGLPEDNRAGAVCDGCGARYDALAGVPVLIRDADLAAIDLTHSGGPLPTYDSAGMGIAVVEEAFGRGDRVL